MGALDDFLSSSQPETRDKAFKIAPDVQQKRDQGRMQILQGELDQNTTNLNSPDADTRRRAQANIEMIRREMGGSKQPPKSAQSTSALDDFLNQSQELGPPVKVQIAGTVKEEPKQIPQVPATQTPTQPTTGEKLVGLGELGLTAASSLVAPIVGGVAGIAENVFGGTLGTKEGLQKAEETAGKVSQALTYEPRTEAGKAVTGRAMGTLQEAFEASKLPPVMPEALPIASARKPIIEKAPVVKPIAVAERIEPAMGKPKLTAEQYKQKLTQEFYGKLEPQAMAGVGAARTADAATLAEAVARATPEIKADLAKVKPGDLNVDALNRVMDADQLPVPVRLTRGQASQDPVIISNERNQRGIKDQVAAHLNEQNKALQENANLMKERVAPDVNTTSFVEDAERSIDLMGKRIKTDDDAITAAYNSLKDYGAGKLEVDSQNFGNNAMKALREFDEQEFLPPSILNRIKDYTEGKAMNFNQFENLRTVLARETRKAQAANDGNAVHALTVVRSELEKMPLLNETGEAKVLADKARSLAKSQFDLLDKKRDTYNPLYADVMNGIADTKDFIPKLVFRSKNKDFVKTMQTLSEGDPQAVQHLRSGALDYMIRESTDASGNFLTGKFNKLVDNLDVNKKLDVLFGDEAKTIRAIASTGKIVEARPKGSFVNESNTAVAAAQMAKQYGAELLKNIPGVKYFVEPASQVLQQRQIAKDVKQTIKPAAGVRLSDIGKKK
jgi:hypothetical protein